LGFRGELFDALGEHFLLAGGLQPARHRRFELCLHLVDGAVCLADGLAHDGVAASLFHAIHCILDGRREQTRHTSENRFSHAKPLWNDLHAYTHSRFKLPLSRSQSLAVAVNTLATVSAILECNLKGSASDAVDIGSRMRGSLGAADCSAGLYRLGDSQSACRT